MLRRITAPIPVLVILASLLFTFVDCFAKAPSQKYKKSKVPVRHVVEQVYGSALATLNPSYYPVFSAYESDNPVCGEYLKRPYNPADPLYGFSYAPLWVVSRYSSNGFRVLTGPPGFTTVPGLILPTFALPEEYRGTAKLLIIWTVRVEGYKDASFAPYIVRANLCSTWNGTSNQRFDGGPVHTRLYINDAPFGKLVSLTIPDSGLTTSFEPRPARKDPTITGSCLVSKEDFVDGYFPATMKIEIKWSNETCLRVQSLNDMRNMIIAVVPITTPD